MRRLFPALLLALCASVALPPDSQAESNASSLRADYSSIHQHTLDNGLTVVVVEDHNVPIVTIEMAVRNGAFTETIDNNGLSHLYEHMFFKANDVYESQEAYMERQRELGMAWNGTTSTERVNYFFTLPSELVEDGVEFMAAALLTPRFEAVELAREIEVVLGEYDRAEANPYWGLWRAMGDQLWYEHPERKLPIGTREAITNATIEQMLELKDLFYVPNNSLLVLSGDIRSEAGLAIAERHFGAHAWPRAEDPFERAPVPEHPPLTEDTAAVASTALGVSVVQMAWHGPNTRDSVEDTYAADVFITAASMATSALQRALVDTGIALSASVGYSTQRYTGPITFHAVAAHGQEASVIEAMNRELLAMQAGDYIDEDLLEIAKTSVAIQDLEGQMSSLGLAHTLSYWWCSADLDYYLNYIENIQAVTLEDIQRFIARWITDQPRATVLLSTPEVTDAWTPERLVEAVQKEVSP